MELNSRNYFSVEANKEYMSVSQFKAFLGCEARQLACVNGEYRRNEKSEALNFGTLLHKWNEGEEAFIQYQAEHPEFLSTRGTTKGQLKSTYKKVYELIDKINNDNLFKKALHGEKEAIFTAEMFGTKWKICIDSYNPSSGYFTDLKAIANIHDTFWSDEYQKKIGFIQYYKYDLQMVVYSEIEKLATKRNENLTPYLAVITKQEPPDSTIFKGFLEYKDVLLEEVSHYMPRILELKKGTVKPIHCGKCDYCRSVKDTQIVQYRR